MEQRLFTHPYPVPVPFGICRGSIGDGLLDGSIGGSQFFSGKAVMEHQQIPGEKDMLYKGNFLIGVDEAVLPCQRDFFACIMAESGFDILSGNIVGKNGADDIHPLQ